jgi:tetratricopeptide (TPR) repeat protein
MLTGRLPYRVSGKAAGALQKAICDGVPDPPGLRNDLDNILGMALRKEPERRYGSVEQFAEDVRRYLEGRPVLAQKDTTWYVARKFVARNRVAVGAAAAVLIAVVTGAVVSSHEARRASIEAARAERRFQQVRGLARTLMYDLNDKIADLPHSLEARVLLVRTASDYLDSLARESEGDPALEWELAKAFERVGNLQGTNLITAAQGGIGPGLGDDRGAYANYRKAQAIEERLLQRSPSDRKIQESLLIVYNNLGLLAESPGEAVRYAQTGLQLARAMKPPPAGAPDKGSASHLYVTLGRAHMLAGDPVAALESFRGTKRVDARIWEPSALAATGDPDGAIRAIKVHLPLAAREAEKARPGTLVRRIIEMGLTWLYLTLGDRLGNPETINLGRAAEALRELRRAISLAEANHQRDPNDGSARDALVRAHLSLGAVLRESDPNAAVESYRRALELGGPFLRASVTDPRRLPGDAHSQLAATLLRAGRIKEALGEARQGTAANSARVPFTFYTLGDVLYRSGDRDAAANAYREAVTIAEGSVAKYPRHMPSRIALAAAYAHFGTYYQSLGQSDEARSWFEREVQVWREWPKYGVSSEYDRTRLEAAEQRARRAGGAALRLRSAASHRAAPSDSGAWTDSGRN